MACPLTALPNVSSGAAGAAQGRSRSIPRGHLQSESHGRTTACDHPRRGRTNETGAVILYIAHRCGAGGEWGSHLSRSFKLGPAVAATTSLERQLETIASMSGAAACEGGMLPDCTRPSLDRRAGIEALPVRENMPDPVVPNGASTTLACAPKLQANAGVKARLQAEPDQAPVP